MDERQEDLSLILLAMHLKVFVVTVNALTARGWKFFIWSSDHWDCEKTDFDIGEGCSREGELFNAMGDLAILGEAGFQVSTEQLKHALGSWYRNACIYNLLISK